MASTLSSCGKKTDKQDTRRFSKENSSKACRHVAWNTCEQDKRTVGRDEGFFRYSPWSVSGMIQIGQSVTLL